MQAKFRLCLEKKAALENTVTAIKKVKGEKDGSMNFTCTIRVPGIEKKDKPAGLYNTVCITCTYTCHYDCAIALDANKAGCAAMSNGYCRHCPKKCHW